MQEHMMGSMSTIVGVFDDSYNAEQAPIAWKDMLAFFKQHLGA